MDAEKYKEASFKIIVRDDPENAGAHASTKGWFLNDFPKLQYSKRNEKLPKS